MTGVTGYEMAFGVLFTAFVYGDIKVWDIGAWKSVCICADMR